MNYRKIFLIAFLCSIAAAAAVGILGMVSERYGDEKLLGTMASVALFSLTALASAIVLDKQKWAPVMWISFAISAIGVITFIFMIYFENSLRWEYQDYLGRANGIIATLGLALPIGGLLALTRFEASGLQIIRVAGIAIVYITAGIICFGILELFNDGEGFFKLLGVTMILTALSVISLPVLHKVAGMPPESETVASDLSLTIVCPRCSLSQSVKSGALRCAQCRLKFVIEVEEPRCPKCRYLLYQLTEPRCPECGTPIDNAEVLPVIQAT